MGTTATGTKTFSYTNSSGGTQVWLKATGANTTDSEIWTFSVDGLPSSATITSSNLTFGVSYSYNSPSRERVSWGTVDGTNVLYSEGSSFSSGTKGPYDLYTPGYLTTTGSKSIIFYKKNSSKGTTYIAYSSPVVQVGYSYPIGDPTPPTSVSVSNTNVGPNTNVTLSWSGAGAGVNNAISGYHVYRSTSASGTYSFLTAVSTTATSGSCVVTSPPDNSSYYYKVYTLGATGYNSAASGSYATLTTTYTAPNPPTSVLVNGASSTYVAEGGTLTLSWSGASNGTNQAVLSYKVYVDGTLYGEDVTANSITVPSYGAGAHNWTIYSVGAYSISASSVAATAYTYSAPTAPTTFTITPAVSAINSNITLNWSGASGGTYNNIVGYEIFRDGTSLGTTTDTTITYISPPSLGTYTYTIRTLGERSNSSNVASATLTTTVPSWAEWNEEEDMYIKQNFVHGQIVTADNLNHIEEGLEAISANARAYNLLDNSDFKNPVNQRGATSYTGTGSSKVYTIDRWATWQNVANGVQITSDGILLADNVGLVQYVPLEYFKTGKTYTFAAMKSSKEIVVLTATYGSSAENDSISAAWEGAYGVGYGFFLKSGTYEWAALYEGEYTVDSLPVYTPKGYGAELAECRRYYQVLQRQIVNFSNSAPSGVYYTNSIMFEPMRSSATGGTPTIFLEKFDTSVSDGVTNAFGVVQGQNFVSTAEVTASVRTEMLYFQATDNKYAGRALELNRIFLNNDL